MHGGNDINRRVQSIFLPEIFDFMVGNEWEWFMDSDLRFGRCLYCGSFGWAMATFRKLMDRLYAFVYISCILRVVLVCFIILNKTKR